MIPKGWIKRFSDKVDIRTPAECWPWKAVKIPGGYGQFWLGDRMVNAHRAALTLMGATIYADQVVRHSCDNPECCNPSHLSVGMQADNMLDAHQKRRHCHGETHGMVILSENEVREILANRENATQAAIRYGVSKTTIHDIRQGRRWRHVTRGSH
jgi:Zinc-binding loop region of homing endonuclease